MEDYYALLNVQPGAAQAEIEAALRQELRTWSRRASNAPRMEDRQEAEKRVAALGRVRATLGNPTTRAQYDAGRRGGPQSFPVMPPSIPDIGRPIAPHQQPEQTRQGPFSSGPTTPFSRFGMPQGVRGPRLLRWMKAHKRISAAIIIAIIAIASAGSHGGGKGSTPSGPSLVTGVQRAAILAPVVAAIRSCADSAVTSPANCPQQVSTSGATGVVWHLYGDPSSGAQVTGSGNRYSVFGVAVMTLSYEDNGANFSVQPVSYEAQVSAAAAKPTLTLLGPQQDTPPSPVAVPRPNLSSRQLDAAVKKAFAKCVASTSPTPPQYCATRPDSGATSSGVTSGKWALQGNPLQNSRVTYDNTAGLFNVDGSYSMTFSYKANGNATVDPFSGNYDAQIADDSGHAVLLTLQAGS